jgi:hypothetical protein
LIFKNYSIINFKYKSHVNSKIIRNKPKKSKKEAFYSSY